MDEIPAYQPAGAGPHLYLHVEKRGRTTRDVIRALAHRLGVAERDAGYAGMKDKEAIATQWLSFPVARDPDSASLAGEGYRILQVARHGNRLRTGHLRGNRFSIRVRGGDIAAAQACAAAVASRGLPNFFGSQRFGVDDGNARVGKALILGRDQDGEVRRAARDRFLRRLCLSAYQSHLFNRWLEARLAAGLFARAVQGDVMKKLDTGGLFTCADPGVDSPRVEKFEISPAGPLFGHKMRPAEGAAFAHEAKLLDEEGITLSDFARGGGEAEGTRRAARLPVAIELEPTEDGYRAAFELPKGSYATVVMGELVKGDIDVPES